MSTARTPTSLSSRLCPHEIRPLVARRREQMNNRVNRIHGWCASRRPPRPGASGRYGRRSAVPDEFSSGAAGSAAGAQRRRPLGLHEGQYVSGSDSSASPRSALILYWLSAVLLACTVGPRDAAFLLLAPFLWFLCENSSQLITKSCTTVLQYQSPVVVDDL